MFSRGRRIGMNAINQRAEEVALRENVHSFVEQRIGTQEHAPDFMRQFPGVRSCVVGRGCTSAAVAKRMCSSGFGVFSELDPGYYGKGLYFTLDADYALRYTQSDPTVDGLHVLVVGYAVIGSPFPVIEQPEDSPHHSDKSLSTPQLMAIPNVDSESSVAVHRESHRSAQLCIV